VTDLDDELRRLSAAHHRELLAQQNAAADLIGAAWNLYQPLDALAASQFIAAAEQIIAGAVSNVAASAVAMMLENDRALGIPGVPELPLDVVIRNGASPRDVYMRAVYQARRRVAAGASFDDAMRSGLSRARQTAATDVSLANRQAIANAAPLRPHVVGYRRVLTGISCALCATASTQRYRSAELAPLHPACDCDIAEIIGTHDPGRIINRELLGELRAAGRDGPGNYYDPDAPYVVTADGRIMRRELVDVDGTTLAKAGDPVEIDVDDHGELGRVVTDRRHQTAAGPVERDTPTAKAKPSRYSPTDAKIVSEAQRRGMTPAQVIAEREAKDAAKAARVAADRKAMRELSVDSPEVRAVADRFGVDPDEVLTARSRVGDVRARMREEAAQVQAEAFGTLERYGTWKVQRPSNAVRAGGEYDWLEQLDARERARLSRLWYSDNRSDAPDLLAQAIGFADPRYADDVDAAVEHWLDLTRRYEAAGSLRRGKLPSSAAYSDAIDANDILAASRADGYDAVLVFGDELTAAGHVAAVERELTRLDAEQFLGDAIGASSPPWSMGYQSWYEDVVDLEYRFREGIATAADADRYAVLVPQYLDEPELGFEDLYARIVDTARRAGQEVSPNARIPW
jgi:hypothetical protein